MGLPYQTQEEIEKSRKIKLIVDRRRSNQKPCLFFFKELTGETMHAFFDPIKRKLRHVEIPELSFQVQCLASGYGWLLLLSRETSSIFFFNPSTRVRIDLPYRKHYFDAAAFSASPTSPDCMVFAVEKPFDRTQIDVDVLRIGELMWTSCTHYSKNFDTVVQVLYCGGLLYCTDSLGRIGTFNAGEDTWSVIHASKCPIVRNSFLVESGGEIFAGTRGPHGGLDGLYKLKLFDQEEVGWMKVRELGDATVFLGPYGSCVYSSTCMDEMEKKVLVSGYRSDAKCAVYGLDGCDCKEEIVFESTRFGLWYTPVWI